MAVLTLVEWVELASAAGTIAAAVAAAYAARAANASAKAAQRQLPEVQRQAEAANEQVRAAQEQVEIQRRTRIDELQPQVWVDIQLDQEVLLVLAVGNNGPSVARNVQVFVEPPIVPIEQFTERFNLALDRLGHGLPALTPDRVLTWPIGQSFNIIKEGCSQLHAFKLLADGPFGPIEPVKFTIDLADFGGSMTL